MTNGLKLIKWPGYYGATRIGWLRRVSGDEYVLEVGWRTVWRTSGDRLLEHLAADGPLKDHELGDPAKGINELTRLGMGDAMPADETAWKAHCPRPKDFPR